MVKKVLVRGVECEVHYVSKEHIYPAFGYAQGNQAMVREDLSPRIKRFVESHELYHCTDTATWGDWIGREIRANFFPGCKDPFGLMATIFATILNVDRLKFYAKRFREGF